MSNYTREELANKIALTNQMRNNLYHFLRFLNSKGLSERDVRNRLERMGKNIAVTLLEEISFSGESLEEFIFNIYKDIFESKVQFSRNTRQLVIEDKKCSLCRYRRVDLTAAPCIIIVSLITEICKQNGFKISEYTVDKSVALGDISCIHAYATSEERE